MIGFISGKTKVVSEEWAIIMTATGVGYKVHIPAGSVLEEQEIELFVYTSVRENDISLWGFISHQDLRLFEVLLGVSGIGHKTAYSLINNLGAGLLISAIISSNPDSLKAPGVGKKTAERLVLELRDKIKEFGHVTEEMSGKPSMDSQAKAEAIEALVGLGYREADVRKAMSKESLNDSLTTEEIVRIVLSKI